MIKPTILDNSVETKEKMMCSHAQKIKAISPKQAFFTKVHAPPHEDPSKNNALGHKKKAKQDAPNCSQQN